MKSIFIIICSLFFSMAYSQEKKVYTFYVELNHFSNAPKFINANGVFRYAGTNVTEKDFFSTYTILDFFQAFPDSRRTRTLNVFMVATYDKNLMSNMVSKFPEKYLFIEDVSDTKVELLDASIDSNTQLFNVDYTDDYGTTSPIPNNGISASLKSFDYINVPKAWHFTKGDSNIKIGISDTKIDTTDIDFKFKTSFLAGYGNQNSLPYGGDNYHGTGVAGIAAAQGDNSHALTGICSNCSIVATRYLYGSPGTYLNPNPNLNNLLQLAISGVKVINMSWRLTFNAPRTVEQWIFDEIHDDYDVVLVAAAGNEYNESNLYKYPASYNHVMSVSSVNHKNNWGDDVVEDATYGPISRYVADQVGLSVAHYNGGIVSWPAHTLNVDVDICAPGYQFFRYSAYLGEGAILYGSGTSGAAPHVSGTVGLMFSLNDCLKSDEVEDILQLTTKNLEGIPGNEPFSGRMGAGKLEAGDAVEFVYEMKNSNGNVLIDGQDFYRFNFKLEHINNKLTISNQIFRDANTADFTAKKIIEILPGSDLKPNADGFVDLKINSNLDIACTSIAPSSARKSGSQKEIGLDTKAKLYPNPNNGTFEITLNKEVTNAVGVDVYDLYGKVIYKTTVQNSKFSLNIPNLPTGMYIIKLSSGEYNEILKFIKN